MVFFNPWVDSQKQVFDDRTIDEPHNKQNNDFSP